MDLNLIRQLDESEADDVRAANTLLFSLASVAPYARLVDLYRRLAGALRSSSSAKRRANEMNRTARALGRLAAEFPGEILDRGRVDFGDGSPEFVQLEQAVSEECERVTFRFLVALGRLDSGPFTAVDESVGNDPDAVVLLQESIPEINPSANLVEITARGLLVAQRLVGRQLEVYGERLDSATLLVRRLAAEAFDGAAGLMFAEVSTTDGELNLGARVTPEALHIDHATALHRARRLARQLLQTDTAPGPEIAGKDTATDVQEPAPGSAEAFEGSTAAESPAPANEAPEPPAGDRTEQVVDLRALASTATELVDSLERAWSDALEPSALGAAHEELQARIGGLLATIQRRASASDRTLRAAGIDPALPAFPMPVEALASIAFRPDREQRLRQLQNAEIEALMLLVPAIKALTKPSAERITLTTGEVETWWEAGAFALVRERARLLVRISEELEVAEAELLDRPVPETMPKFFDHLRLGSDAISRGDMEGALAHAALALRLRASTIATVSLPELCTALSADERTGEKRFLMTRLEEALVMIGAGEALDLGAATLLAPRVLEVVAWLCLEAGTLVEEAATNGAGSNVGP